MISIEEAKESIKINVVSTQTKLVALADSVHCYLAEAIVSPINMPPFRQSAMDGYALCMHNSKEYTVVEEIKAGDSHSVFLKAGEATRIFTGAAIPKNANVVVMQEQVVLEKNVITLTNEVTEGDHIRPLGEQVKQNSIALEKGTRLTSAGIGFLASLGIQKVQIYEKPSIAIIVTGNELLEADAILTSGKIYESNSVMLQSALNEGGFTNNTVYKVTDNYKDTLTVLDKAMTKHDIVLVTGGISVGDYDFVGKVLKELHVKQLFYKVNQKPGKPLFFGKKEEVAIFALPGNPAAALTCFYMYVYPALQNKIGALDFELKKTQEITTSSFMKKGGRPQFLKAFYQEGKVTLLEGQSSAMLQTFALANALVLVPEEQTIISKGDTVEVIHLPNL